MVALKPPADSIRNSNLLEFIMKQQIISFAIVTAAAFTYPNTVTAQSQGQLTDTQANQQDLTLFEPVQVSAENTSRSPARPNRESRATTSEPPFTLMGTSRIGDNYSAMVKHRGGETIIVRVGANGNTPIPDYSGYSIVDVAAGNISIRYPGNSPCIEFSGQGVSCNDAANIARLTLPTSAPLPSVNPPDELIESVEDQPKNPFETLRNGAVAQDEEQAGNAARFTPRRINPEDVPEGMRVISTPFGDRLVAQ